MTYYSTPQINVTPSYAPPPRTQPNAFNAAARGAMEGAPGGPEAAAIGAVSGIGQALIGKHGNSKANQAQERAAKEALDYQRQRDAEDRALQKAQFEYQTALDRNVRTPNMQRLNGLLNNQGRQYGIAPIEWRDPWANLGPQPRTVPGETGTPSNVPVPAPPPPKTLGQLASNDNPLFRDPYEEANSTTATAGLAPRQLTLGDLANWSQAIRGRA